ncbi:MAG: hypothetical protein NZ480_08900 [Bdellovibrionaceae bacterium]|nr:hypothetical protein [Pseudobdellovibrionaceae bacterium]MDW8189411.1 hypothetical protein [Pseudobdellovibrionaceae bacterium]
MVPVMDIRIKLIVLLFPVFLPIVIKAGSCCSVGAGSASALSPLITGDEAQQILMGLFHFEKQYFADEFGYWYRMKNQAATTLSLSYQKRLSSDFDWQWSVFFNVLQERSLVTHDQFTLGTASISMARDFYWDPITSSNPLLKKIIGYLRFDLPNTWLEGGSNVAYEGITGKTSNQATLGWGFLMVGQQTPTGFDFVGRGELSLNHVSNKDKKTITWGWSGSMELGYQKSYWRVATQILHSSNHLPSHMLLFVGETPSLSPNQLTVLQIAITRQLGEAYSLSLTYFNDYLLGQPLNRTLNQGWGLILQNRIWN